MPWRVLSLFFAALALWYSGTSNVRAATGASGLFNVRDYDAAGDGKTLDNPAINQAIEACSAAGGGTVLVPAGTYLSGSIHLRSNVHLVIDAGATLLGAPQNMNAYDETEPYALGGYQDGGHCYFHNSLIWGENLTNVFITGHGLINGGGLVRSDGVLDRMVGFNKFNPPVTNPAPPIRLGNKAIALKLCRNVLIRDVTIYHGGHFAILVTGCDNLTVDNVTTDTDRDGIDIDCCRNTMVSNCRINSPNDDGLCPKSTYALGETRLTENLTIVNCQVCGFEEGTLLDGTFKPSKNHNGRIKFGTESSGGFRNCTVANCAFRSCRGLALEEVDGGVMENITINNITMMDVPDYAIYITTGKRNRTPGAATTSRAKSILISNVIADGVGKMSGIQIMGLPDLPVEGVRLQDIRLTSKGGGTRQDAARHPKELGAGYPEPRSLGVLPSYGIYARHVHDLEIADVHLAFENQDERPAIACIDAEGVTIDDLSAQVADGVSAAQFEAVRGLAIRNSPGLENQKP
ncbi:MAG TPA: glycoside hydrolase family 28 protein [Verrucomicrobiae bacterium]|nr:glycoside hydrolase family 28 protein [Verrucomicrobiae bacterium]